MGFIRVIARNCFTHASRLTATVMFANVCALSRILSCFGCATVPVVRSFDAALLKVTKITPRRCLWNCPGTCHVSSALNLKPAWYAWDRQPRVPWKLPLHFQTPGGCPSDSVVVPTKVGATVPRSTGGCRNKLGSGGGAYPQILRLYARVRTIGDAVYHDGLHGTLMTHDSRLSFTEHPAARCQGVVVGLALVPQPGCLLQPEAGHVRNFAPKLSSKAKTCLFCCFWCFFGL